MELEFRAQYLLDLYEGIVTDNRFKSNPQLVRQYVKVVKILERITRVEQLYQIKSLRYEKKLGNLKGKSAVYINKQYRLIFEEITDSSPPFTVRVLALEEISKHYEK